VIRSEKLLRAAATLTMDIDTVYILFV